MDSSSQVVYGQKKNSSRAIQSQEVHLSWHQIANAEKQRLLSSMGSSATQMKLDYSAANHYLHTILAFPSDDWHALENKFKPVFESLRENFVEILDYNEFYTRAETEAEMHAHLFSSRPDCSSFVVEHLEDAFGEEKKESEAASEEQKFGKYFGEATKAADDTELDEAVPLQTITFLNKYSNETERGLRRLREEYFIRTLPHSQYKNLVHLLYTVASPMDSLLVRECSGLVVAWDRCNAAATKRWRAVCCPLLHFPHYYPESNASEELCKHWQTFEAWEKIDGTRAMLYWYNNEWQVASKWDADGKSQLGWKSLGQKQAIADLFWTIWHSSAYTLPSVTDRTYIFQIASNKHRYVVSYPTCRLVLIAVNTIADDGTVREEKFERIAKEEGYECPAQHTFCSLTEAWATCQAQNPFVCSGFVLTRNTAKGSRRRLCLESSQYVALQSTMNLPNKGFGPMNLNADNLEAEGMLLEIVRRGISHEFLAYFGDKWAELHRSCWEAYISFCEDVKQCYLQLLDSFQEDQKAFARGVNSYPAAYRSILFGLRKHSVLSVEEYLQVTRNKVVLTALTNGLTAALVGEEKNKIKGNLLQ
ncbi:hypothetical protein QOT17_001411 [Balamuthia mandrillaris]